MIDVEVPEAATNEQGPSSVEITIEHFKNDPVIAASYKKDAGVIEGYSLEVHTSMVIGQFERYFAPSWDSSLMPSDHFRSLLAVHDVMKPEAVENGEKGKAHEYTLKVAIPALVKEGFSENELKIARAVIDQDIIGDCFKKKISPEMAAGEIAQMATALNVANRDMLMFLRAYYVCDAGSYTHDAGSVGGLLDGIFEFDREAGKVEFSKHYQALFSDIEKSLPMEEIRYLGMTDIGFDSAKLQELEQELSEINQRIPERQSSVVEERRNLIYELYSDEEIQKDPRKSRWVKGTERTGPVQPDLTREERTQKTDRLLALNFPLGETGVTSLLNKRRSLETQIETEKLKKPDSLELDEVYEALRREGKLPEVKHDVNSDDVILSKANSPPFELTVPIDSRTVAVKEKAIGEIWFHSTNHLAMIVNSGGLGTQSWIQKNTPEYYQLMVENSGARGGDIKDASLRSPLIEEDANVIYFRPGVVETYGTNIIAYDPSDLLLDTDLFFVREGRMHVEERLISDVCNREGDDLRTGDDTSSLHISLDKAYIAVDKSDYSKTVRQFLLSGYSREWIAQHVFSYRGVGVKFFDAQHAAVNEIKRRIETSRQKQDETRKIIAVPNPQGPHGSRMANLFQLKTV